MKKGTLITMLLPLLAVALAPTSTALCCSMLKITLHGKTIIGNNEDYWNPNARIWFEQGGKGEYGVAYVGFDNFWPQGGINQAGLVFDGFSQDYLAIKDTVGKEPLSMTFLKEVMKRCGTIDEVKRYFRRHSLSGLESSSFLFVDKSGRYLSVDGDSLISGDREWYIASNFHPSQTNQECNIPLPFYQKGRELLETRRDTSVNFCVSAMETMHQQAEWGAGTIYTSIYDPNAGMIYLYFYRDFTHCVKLNLNKELQKGNHSLSMPNLFPENVVARNFVAVYNIIGNEMELLRDEDIMEDSTRYDQVLNSLLTTNKRLTRTFTNRISAIADFWMTKKNYKAAIKVFKVNTVLNPDSWSAYESLAEAYNQNNDTAQAIACYEKSLAINPESSNGKLQLERLKTVRRSEPSKSEKR